MGIHFQEDPASLATNTLHSQGVNVDGLSTTSQHDALSHLAVSSSDVRELIHQSPRALAIILRDAKLLHHFKDDPTHLLAFGERFSNFLAEELTHGRYREVLDLPFDGNSKHITTYLSLLGDGDRTRVATDLCVGSLRILKACSVDSDAAALAVVKYAATAGVAPALEEHIRSYLDRRHHDMLTHPSNDVADLKTLDHTTPVDELAGGIGYPSAPIHLRAAQLRRLSDRAFIDRAPREGRAIGTADPTADPLVELWGVARQRFCAVGKPELFRGILLHEPFQREHRDDPAALTIAAALLRHDLEWRQKDDKIEGPGPQIIELALSYALESSAALNGREREAIARESFTRGTDAEVVRVAQRYLASMPDVGALCLRAALCDGNLELLHLLITRAHLKFSDADRALARLELEERQREALLKGTFTAAIESNRLLKLCDYYLAWGMPPAPETPVMVAPQYKGKFLLLEHQGELFIRTGGVMHRDILEAFHTELRGRGYVRSTHFKRELGGGEMKPIPGGYNLFGKSDRYGACDFERAAEVIRKALPGTVVTVGAAS